MNKYTVKFRLSDEQDSDSAEAHPIIAPSIKDMLVQISLSMPMDKDGCECVGMDIRKVKDPEEAN